MEVKFRVRGGDLDNNREHSRYRNYLRKATRKATKNTKRTLLIRSKQMPIYSGNTLIPRQN